MALAFAKISAWQILCLSRPSTFDRLFCVLPSTLRLDPYRISNNLRVMDYHHIITIEPGIPDLVQEDIRACLALAAGRERKLAALPAGNCASAKISRPFCPIPLPVCFPASSQ